MHAVLCGFYNSVLYKLTCCVTLLKVADGCDCLNSRNCSCIVAVAVQWKVTIVWCDHAQPAAALDSALTVQELQESS